MTIYDSCDSMGAAVRLVRVRGTLGVFTRIPQIRARAAWRSGRMLTFWLVEKTRLGPGGMDMRYRSVVSVAVFVLALQAQPGVAQAPAGVSVNAELTKGIDVKRRRLETW